MKCNRTHAKQVAYPLTLSWKKIISLGERCSGVYRFTRVAYITRVGLWLPISLDSCLCCEEVIKPKVIYGVLMRPKIRPKRASALNWWHVKTLFQFQTSKLSEMRKNLFLSSIKSWCIQDEDVLIDIHLLNIKFVVYLCRKQRCHEQSWMDLESPVISRRKTLF